MKTLLSLSLVLVLAAAAVQAQESPKKIAIGLDADANELFQAQQVADPVEPPVTTPVTDPVPPTPPADEIIQIKGPDGVKTVIVKPQSPRQRYGYAGHGGIQWGGRGYSDWGDYNHASTAAEGYLSGVGRLREGQARFLEGLGRYQNMHQEARTKAIENWSFGVETWWYLKDQYRERKYGKDWIDKENHRLDQIERRKMLEWRKKDFIAKGMLPKPQPQSCVIRGRKYKTVDEWKGTADHILHQLELQERDIRNALKKLRSTDAFRRVVEWERMSEYERHRYRTKQKAAAVLGEPTPDLITRKGREMAELSLEEAQRQVLAKQKAVKEFIKIKGNVVIDPVGGK